MMYNPRRAVHPPRRNDAYEAEGRVPPAADEQILAMVSGVSQKFEDLYTPMEALCAGTLFRQLDLPFHKGFRL